MATRYYLDKRADKYGDYPIRVSISINGDRLQTSVGYNISPDKWDIDTQRVIRGCSNGKKETYKDINTRLKDIDTYFAKIDVKLTNGDLEEVNIKDLFNAEFRKNKPIKKDNTFFDYYDEFLTEQGKDNSWTSAVYEKFNALKNHLQNWKKNISFNDLNKDGLNSFVDYLHNIIISGKKTKDKDTRVFGMKNSTIKKQLGFLKWFLRWATDKGYNTETNYLTFKPKLITPDKKVVFLNWDELMTVYNFEIPKEEEHLEKVRDVLCFCSFTSLRYSDVANLKRSDVYDDHIEITTIKTVDSLIIDLNDYSKAILKKYEGISFPKNRALPIISNQRMNEYIKELGELCGIDEPITITYFKGNKRYDEVYPKYALMGTHTGRRTFISNAIMMGIAPQIVMKWTGHSDYKAMKPYIDIADKARVDAMKKFNEK